MITRIIRYLLISFISLWFFNCSLDGASILKHPNAANPNTEITVEILNTFIRLEQSSLISQAILRDSIHIGIGLPAADWSVTSVGIYPAPQFRPLRGLDPALVYDSTYTPSFLDSMTAYKARQLPAGPNPSLPGFFLGRTFDVDVEGTDSTFTLDADTVGTWYGFSGVVNISLDFGETVDLAVPNEDTTVDIDTIGYSMIPVYITATINVGADLGNFNLYYYTKTGPLPQEVVDTSTINLDFDVGDMTYYPFEVKTGIINVGQKSRSYAVKNLEVLPLNNNVFQITTYTDRSIDDFYLDIYDIKGTLIKSFSNQGDHQNTQEFIWDGTDLTGGKVRAGIYFVNYVSNSGSVSKKITLKG